MNTLLETAHGLSEANAVELSRLDLRYECWRLRHAAQETRLLASMVQRGIQEPLEGVTLGERLVLLNGFKRYRCAQKLHIHRVPYLSLGPDETAGILSLLRSSNQKALSLLEQAGFVDELQRARNLSVAEIAAELAVSKAWVSVRLGLMAELSPAVRRQLFSGAFPVYCYMYSLRPIRRINGVSSEQIEEFIGAVAGRQLSVREIEQLAQGYFRGPASFGEEIRRGNLALPLERMKQAAAHGEDCSPWEQILLNDLETTQKYMQRVMGKSQDPRIHSRAFHAQSHLLTAGILSRARAFFQTLRQLHDRNGQA
jgi:hypothetical protein